MSRPLPTRSGWGLVATGCALVLAGLSLGYPELVLPGIAALLLVAAALGWVLVRPGVTVDRAVEPARVAVGGTAEGVLTIGNGGSRPVGSLTAVDHVGGEPVAVGVPALGKGGVETIRYPLPTRRRGIVSVGPLVVARSDPFGLCRSGRTAGAAATLWVHPRVHTVGVRPGGVVRHVDAPATDMAPQGTMNFHTLREYVRGDDLRFVHWRSTARTGTLMLRHHVDTSRPVTTVVLDTRTGAYDGAEAFEVAVEAAASVLVSSVRHMVPARLVTTFGVSVGGRSGTTSAGALLDCLAGVVAADGTFRSAAVQLREMTGKATLTVVTGNTTTAELAVLAQDCRRFGSVTVVAVQPAAVDRPSAPPALRGARTIVVANGRDFAAKWNSGRGVQT